MTYLINLPVESLHYIAQFLLPQDVLNFISIHPSFVPLLCHSKQFWIYLYEVHYGMYEHRNVNNIDVSSTDRDNTFAATDWVIVKRQYLLKSYCNTLPMVRWYPVDTKPPGEKEASFKKHKTDRVATPSEPLFIYEEPPQDVYGFLSCIGNYVVLYCDDNVYIKNIQQFDDGTTWKRLLSVDCSNLQHVCFGTTLNTLDNTRAVMFGGAKSQGGPGNRETSQVAVLHIEENESDITATATTVPNVWWEVIDQCHVSDNPSMICSDSNSAWLSLAGRAYHASTLIFDRYLFIVGGLQKNGDYNILNPMLLDCQTWTWYVDGVTTSCPTKNNATGNKRKLLPSNRHGCSIIADVEYRNRLLLFGGSSGDDFNDISGNSEVWELMMNHCNSSDGVLSSMPWKWKLLHKDQTDIRHRNDDSDDEQDNGNNSDFQMNPSNVLNFVERLNLGQCHCGYRVGVDTVILAFGKVGDFMTNSVLCYCLKDDCFFRTYVHNLFHPSARNISASAYIESKGIIIFYGGVSAEYREGNIVSDTIILDLAPTLNVQEPNDRLWLPIDKDAERHTTTKYWLARR